MEMYASGKMISATDEQLSTKERIVTSESGARTTLLANSYVIVFCEANDDLECCFQYLLVNKKHWFELVKDFADRYRDDETPWSARRIYPFEASERIAIHLKKNGNRQFALMIKALVAEEVLPSDAKLERSLESLITIDSGIEMFDRGSAKSFRSEKLAIEHLLTFRRAVFESINRNSAADSVASVLPPSSKRFLRNLELFLQPFGDHGAEIRRATTALLAAKIGDCDAELSKLFEVTDRLSPKALPSARVGEAHPANVCDDQIKVKTLVYDMDFDAFEPTASEKTEEELQGLMFDLFFFVFVKCRESWECDALWQMKSEGDVTKLKQILFGKHAKFDVSNLESRITHVHEGLKELAMRTPNFSEWKTDYRHLLVSVLWQRADSSWDQCSTIMRRFLGKTYTRKNMLAATSAFLKTIGSPFALRQGEPGVKRRSEQVEEILKVLLTE